MSSINWNQAVEVHKSSQENKIVNREKLIREIELSDFEEFDARDINYYAAELRIEPNEVRLIYLRANPEVSHFNLLETFLNDDTDEIFGFF